jgi:hypothetical protein
MRYLALGKVYLCLILCTITFTSGYAQQARQVSGKVVSAEDSTALPGVTILVKGTTSGTTTNGDGSFSLNVPAQSEVLIFSFIGFETQEVATGNRSTINVQMQTDIKALSEVVVTALGIEKQQRELGYVTQKISAENITQARETNVVNQLAGKIAGVTVVSSPAVWVLLQGLLFEASVR